MGTANSSHKTTLILLLLFPVLSFGIGFELAFQADRGRAAEVCDMAGLYLDYSLELKDDMAVIDWSKNMQKSDNVLAFRAMVGPKVLTEGGNRNLVMGNFPLGTTFLFPDLFICHEIFNKNLQIPSELYLTYRANPSPLYWAFFGGLVSLITGFSWWWRLQAKSDSSPSSATAPKQRQSPVAAKLRIPVTSDKEKEPFLLLDKNFVILQASPEAATLFGKGTTDLAQSHLLDLAPDPLLMQAIEKAEEAHLQQAFPASPSLAITVKHGPEGTFLYLKIPDIPKPPQNH